MPYPNQHSARVRDPGDFIDGSFRTKKVTKGVTIIIGKLKGGDGSMVTQAYRFDKDVFTAAEAKAWLKANDVKYISFEAATEGKSIEMEKEIRSVEPTDAEVRALRRGRVIEGYAIVFNKESRDLGGFIEVIKPEAINGVVDRSDVLALLNHNDNRGILARSTNGEGTLELTPTNFGLQYRFEAPETSIGDEVLSGVRRGDIRTSSFSFSVSDGQKWEKRADGTYLRTITKFDKIYDVSPVYREAYADTTVAVRSLVELRTSEAEKIAAEAVQKVADLEKELRDKPSSDSTDAKTADPEKVQKEDLTDYFKSIDEQIKKMKS